MERYLAKGLDQLVTDKLTMEGILATREGSAAALDGMKRRLNVFLEFIKPPGPDPTPEPEESPEPVLPVDTEPPESDQTRAADLRHKSIGWPDASGKKAAKWTPRPKFRERRSVAGDMPHF
jgi:hypothetical protein